MSEELFEWARGYHARGDDPDTSFIAQLLLSEESVQAMLRFALIAHAANPGGLTDEEVKEELELLFPGVLIHDRNHSKRCSDLELHCGCLYDTGLRRTNTTGRSAKVRAITARGLSLLKGRAPIKVESGIWVDMA